MAERGQVESLATAFGDELGLSSWKFERAGILEMASTTMADDDVDALVSVARIADRPDSRVSLAFAGRLSDGRMLLYFVGARPLIPFTNAVLMFDPKATASEVWESFRERMMTDGAPASRDELFAIRARHVRPSLGGLLRFLPEWSKSIANRGGELHG